MVTEGFEFLGFYVVMRWDKRYGYFPRVEIPKATVVDLRYRIKQLMRRDTTWSGLGQKLREINPILRGWAAYYRYGWHLHCHRLVRYQLSLALAEKEAAQCAGARDLARFSAQ